MATWVGLALVMDAIESEWVKNIFLILFAHQQSVGRHHTGRNQVNMALFRVQDNGLTILDLHSLANKWSGPSSSPHIPVEIIEALADSSSQIDFESKEWNLFETSTRWLRLRTLDSFYLRFKPYILIWSMDEMVTISWDNFEAVESGTKVWSSCKGHFTMPIKEYINQVQLFHSAVVAQMEERVQFWIQKDPKHLHLQKEQNQRRNEFALTLKKKVDLTDWNEVLRAVQILVKHAPA